MSNSGFVFAEIDSEQSFNDLGDSLGMKPVNKCIQVPAENGSGSIRKIDFEKGLHIRSWDLTLKKQFAFRRKTEMGTEAGKAFTMVYTLAPDSILLDGQTLSRNILLQGSMNILVLSNCVNLNFNIQPNLPVKAIDVSVSAEWMANQFDPSEPAFVSFMSKLKNDGEPFLFIEKGSSAEYKTAVDLHAHILDGTKSLLYLKAKTLSLVSDFFGRIFTNNPEALTEHNNAVLHREKMLMVEKLLEEHFEKNLPSIEKIAQDAALSESTLKRHFKIMFGKSIYEYYLEKKMDYAKRLLLEKPLTVKEVAYRLGYEKTSNFIHIFKKFHTYSPGHLKKNISF